MIESIIKLLPVHKSLSLQTVALEINKNPQ